ncbi:hypothetical protein Pla52o_50300 [Novipirellula galeiformis]|uniref:SLA1 homology domain-containing protein n=1 Tax=Novipirellula galeiformis TaxID=2528004 RepID=A0A5C6BZW5_9BACT|nr:hypothetical protein [Novipirellula galeiformis]TWU17475.1 hypothetical protein Pla52o_50300 [Novipirellula galeiformis]
MNRIANQLLFVATAFLFANTAVAETTTVPIEIQSVEPRERKITVRYSGKVTTLALSDDATIILEGKATDLTSVIPGDIGHVEFDKTIPAVTKLEVRRSQMAPAEKLDEGWEEIDQRLLFLMVRLVDVEANLDAIDEAMGKSKSRAGIATGQANRAQAGNDRMDRRAGGPVRWDRFYGTTAEKFFYHPTENHTYHTWTVLGQNNSASDNQTEPGVPSRQGLPVHQRPPQFDYMYRANQNAQQRAIANVAKFRGNAAALAAREHELQLEQSKLWCEVAFRAVARNDLDRKPLYRFAPSGTGKEDLLAATKFVAVALSIIDGGQKDQQATFQQIKMLISNARDALGNEWLNLGVNYRDESTDEWRFVSLARRLEDISANLGDSYTVSVKRENAGDSERRDLYRGLLQQALIQYAETVLALDEMASAMAKAKEFEPDLDKSVAMPALTETPTLATPGPVNTPSLVNPTPDLKQWQKGDATLELTSISFLSELDLRGKVEEGKWQVQRGKLYGFAAPKTAKASLGSIPFEHYDLEVAFSTTQRSSNGFGDLIFALPVVQGSLCIRVTKENKTIIGFFSSGEFGEFNSATFSGAISLRTQHKLSVKVRGKENVELSLDGKLVKSFTSLPNLKTFEGNVFKIVLSPQMSVVFDQIDVVNQSQ